MPSPFGTTRGSPGPVTAAQLGASCSPGRSSVDEAQLKLLRAAQVQAESRCSSSETLAGSPAAAARRHTAPLHAADLGEGQGVAQACEAGASLERGLEGLRRAPGRAPWVMLWIQASSCGVRLRPG